jgi:SAM-dependent methyltransferase
MVAPRWRKMVEKNREAKHIPEADLRARQAQVVSLLPERGSILEVGSGEGHTLRLLDKPSRRLVGIDISLAALYNSAEGTPGFDNVQADAQLLPLAADSFDVAVALEVLEHLADWPRALEELFRVARERVIVTVPYREWLKGRRCPNCGDWAPLYGHLHHFVPATFEPWQHRGKMTIKTVGLPSGWRAYWQKSLAWIRKSQSTEENTITLHCPNCATSFPQGLRWQRAVDRVGRLLMRKPEWFLIIWDIGSKR